MPASAARGDVAQSRARRGFSALREFLTVEAWGGLILALAVLGALVWANTWPSSYTSFWAREISVGVSQLAVTESLAHWVTDGLMAIFFFVAGLEIKRELVVGELRNPRSAALPAIAALGGMAVPALIFIALNAGGTGARGWGVPMATDIVFAVAVLALLGRRVPRALKLFLLTLAIVDDVGAIVVIAVFYSKSVSVAWLLGGVLAVLGIAVLRRIGVASPVAYVLPGAVLWLCVLESGVHATIAGVVLGLLTPVNDIRGRPLIERLEHRLHPWSTLVIVPLFALASAGVLLHGESLRHALDSSVTWGIVLGLVVGKPVGILLATIIAVRLRVAELPATLSFGLVLGAGALAGIGFTVSLFVADLSFAGLQLTDAKIGILAASLVSAVAGSLSIWFLGRRQSPREMRVSAAGPR